MLSSDEEQRYITVFFDGACGACSKEIKYYQSLKPINLIKWIDISANTDYFESLGYKAEDGLNIFHVLDENLTMHKGIDGFVVLWRSLPKWRIFAAVIGKQPFNFVAKVFYKLFLLWHDRQLQKR